jgi:hypothetical protein
MKEEIKDLVKESLLEQDDEEEETEIDVDMDAEDSDNMDDESEDMSADNDDDSEESEMDDEMSDVEDDEEELEPIDLTGASDEEILKVFKAMGDDDGIIVKKDNSKIHLKDDNEDVEYMIDLGESMEDLSLEQMDDEEDLGMDNISYDEEDVLDNLFGENSINSEEENYEGTFESVANQLEEDDMEGEIDPLSSNEVYDGVTYEIEIDEKDDLSNEGMYNEDDDLSNEGMYNEEDDLSYEGMYNEEDDLSYEGMYNEEDEETGESYDHTRVNEAKMKAKGRIGKGPKFSYKKVSGGFKEDKKHVNPTKGTGKPKFEYKEGKMKKAETKEAARTLGFGRRGPTGKHAGLRKGITPNRNLGESQIQQYEQQLSILRQKNEEYRKALNIFREKLNEVAVFNSNLAYATRLFTEHSTTKQEKINILRRFDGAETLKESKNLYRTIKEELGQGQKTTMNESISNKIEKDQTSGSSQNLIESKTYENPQFMRMKDLMSKLTK